MAYEVSMVLSLSFILLNSTTNSEGFFSVFSLEMKINILSMFGFFVFYFFFYYSFLFFLTLYFASHWRKARFSLLTLHHIPQGAFSLPGCLHTAGYFLCSELWPVAVFAANKSQAWHASFPCYFLFNFVSQQILKFFFNVSLCEINCIKFQTMSVVLNLAKILCVLITLTSLFARD